MLAETVRKYSQQTLLGAISLVYMLPGLSLFLTGSRFPTTLIVAGIAVTLSLGFMLESFTVALFIGIGGPLLVCLSAVLNDVPLGNAALAVVLVLVPLLALGMATRVGLAGSIVPIWLSVLVSATLIIAIIQLVTGTGVDRAVGWLVNDRAANTVHFLTLLTGLAFAIFTNRHRRIFQVFGWSILVVSAVVAWLGDAKTALGIAVLVAMMVAGSCFISAVVTKDDHWRSQNIRFALQAIAALVIVSPATLAAFLGLWTGSSAPSQYTAIVKTSVSQSAAAPFASESADVGGVHASTRTFMGSGPGTGDSVTSLMITREIFPLAFRFGLQESFRGNPELIERVVRNTGPGSGSLVAPHRTLSGITQEFGVVGFFFYLVAAGVALVPLRRVSWALFTPIAVSILVLGLVNSFLEYVEVPLALAAFVLAARWLLRQEA